LAHALLRAAPAHVPATAEPAAVWRSKTAAERFIIGPAMLLPRFSDKLLH
jgi:hypothetical protein